MDSNRLRIRIIESVLRLPGDHLQGVANYLQQMEMTRQAIPISPDANKLESPIKEWPHAPRHCLDDRCAYMVTTGTYLKAHHFGDAQRLDLLETSLLSTAARFEWRLEGWAVFSNHYHFVGYCLGDSSSLHDFLNELHANTAREINEIDGCKGRIVWHNYWDSKLTFEKSYWARLNYVHQNAVKHGLVAVANQYRWCSAAWLERIARPAHVKTVYSFKIDRVKVTDDFEPLAIL
jgi:REP-associated tyrosine transposase